MNSAVNFIVESGVSISLLAVIYVFFLRKETFFKINRLFLLGSVLFSVILPFLKFQVFNPQPTMLSEVTITPYRNMIEAVTVYSHGFSGSVEQLIVSTNLLIFAYLLGVIFFILRFLIRIVQILLIVWKNKVQEFSGFKLVTIEKEISPFSFLNYIFINHSIQKTEGYDRMIAHEMEHVKQGHSFDVIILEILTAFQWFNPFMWLLRNAIRENHEYLADQAVLTSGVNRGYYKKLLLTQYVGGQLVIANNFNYSIIKKRIKMMSKIKSSKLAITKITFGLLVAGALIIAFACEQKETVIQEELKDDNVLILKHTILPNGKILIEGTQEDLEKFKNTFSFETGFEITTDSLGKTLLVKKEKILPKYLSSDEPVFNIVEDMPEFPGGESALGNYVVSSIKYPVQAQENGIQGKVFVSFVVTKDGSIADCKIARGVDPSLDAEALRVVNALPKWKPGKQRGKVVNVSYTVPINFVLK